jgi:hypothetical protein
MNFITVYEIFGLLVTLVSALIAYLRSPDSAKNQNAAFVSLLGVVFTMLMSMRYDVLPKIEDHLVIGQAVAKNRDLLDMVQKLSQAPDAPKEPLMAYMLNLRLRALENHFNMMAEGKFMVEQSEMPDFALELMRSAKKRVFATSYVQFNDWWNTPWGARYEQINEDNIKKGVLITRIFIFSNKEAFEGARKYMEMQKKAGIDVKYAMTQNLDMKLTSDMVVIDDRLAGDLRLTPDKGMKEAEFYTRQTDVDDIKSRITSVDDESSPFGSETSPNSPTKQGD